jgi:hypothetical protein
MTQVGRVRIDNWNHLKWIRMFIVDSPVET